MSNPAACKAQVPGLLDRALAAGVRYPLHWLDDPEQKELKKTTFTMLLSCHKEDGSGYDEDECFNQIVEKYGLKEQATATGSPSSKGGAGTKRAAAASSQDDEEEGGGGGGGGKKKKKEMVVCEENRPAATVLQELADLYWKAKDGFKGATYSKAAKALRECETFCKNSKEACKLKGIGKSCGALIEEVLATGKCDKLEKLRAGEV